MMPSGLTHGVIRFGRAAIGSREAVSGLRMTALPFMTSMEAISVLSSRFFFAMGAGAVTYC